MDVDHRERIARAVVLARQMNPGFRTRRRQQRGCSVCADCGYAVPGFYEVKIAIGCTRRLRMRYRIAKIVAATAIGIVLLTAAAVAAVPMVRIASGWWNSPDGLAALAENPQVHYETGASEQARIVAGLLPTAIARVEAVHGRRFALPATIGVYITPEAFVAANGLGSRRSVGMTFLGRVMLSPALFSTQRHRLPAILTHELSQPI